MKITLVSLLLSLFISVGHTAPEEHIYKGFLKRFQVAASDEDQNEDDFHLLQFDYSRDWHFEMSILNSLTEDYIRLLIESENYAKQIVLFYAGALVNQGISYRLGGRANFMNEVSAHELSRVNEIDCTGLLDLLFYLAELTMNDNSYGIGYHIDRKTNRLIQFSTFEMVNSIRYNAETKSFYSRTYDNFDVYVSSSIPNARVLRNQIQRAGHSVSDFSDSFKNYFKPKVGDILVYNTFRPSEGAHVGHAVMVVDAENCLVVNSASLAWQEDSRRVARGYDGVQFHKVDESRCKDGKWTHWNNRINVNRWQALYRHKKFNVSTQQSFIKPIMNKLYEFSRNERVLRNWDWNDHWSQSSAKGEKPYDQKRLSPIRLEQYSTSLIQD